MRVPLIMLASMSLAAPSYSQDIIAQPPISEKDIANYCIYASRIYSTGAQICIVRGGITLGCDKGEWKIDLTKYGIDCKGEPQYPAPK